MQFFSGILALAGIGSALATPVIYDGRASMNLTGDMLNASEGPYLTVVKGSTENATYYATLYEDKMAPTPLWRNVGLEQAIGISIDNTSVFIPGGSSPQYGFRRTDFIAQVDNNHTYLDTIMENGTTVFHVSIHADGRLPLNYTHEYQIVWIEPDDGSHVWDIQVGTPFSDPTNRTVDPTAHNLKVRDHALNVLFEVPFTAEDWHNFAVQVDWANKTLGVFYSANSEDLKAVTGLCDNDSVPSDAAGEGDYHFGVLKLPLANPADTPAEQADVVHYGIQEGDKEALIYSGFFVESILSGGVSAGHGGVVQAIS